MKKEYMKPAMQVVRIKQQRHLLSGSGTAKRLSSDDFNWSDGFDGDTSDR